MEQAKGVKYYPPEEKIVSQKVVDTLKQTFESYGYSPLETPTIFGYDLLASKYSGGAEILKETFKLSDQGKRKLCLRYDLTVPLALYISENPNIKLPFKRYEIGKVFRDGPIKKGRLREFWQCDVDTIGTNSILADAECINIANDAFKKIGINATIEVNNRKILDAIMETLKVPESKRPSVITAIDKIKKVPLKEIEKELLEVMKKPEIEQLLRLINFQGSNKQKIDLLKKTLKNQEGVNEIEQLLTYVSAELNIALARGLAYYTGTVFEAFAKDFPSSLAGGGRYDKMIGDYLKNNREYPAVGISFGLEPISILLKKQEQKTTTQIYIIPINTQKECMEIATKIRAQNINAEIDLTGKGISKNLDYANSLSIPYVLIIGENELKANKFKLKDMKSGKEKEININKIEF